MDAGQTSEAAVADPNTNVIVEAGPQTDAARASEPCSTSGARRCAAGAARDVCMNGTWQADEPCPADTVCTTEDPARCPSLLAACVGNMGKSVCAGSVMQHCNDRALSAGTETCQNARLCQLGLDKARCLQCVPGSFKCTGTALETCSEDGARWLPGQTCTTAALCNATAGACTNAACTAGQKRCTGDTLERCNVGATGFELDVPCMPGMCDQVGQQCDVCLPRARTCATATNYRVCQDSGQGYTTSACASATPHCTGNGSCVACLTNTHCADPGECRSATCSGGSCVASNDRLGTSCRLASGGSGLCDGAGSCLPCLNPGDACTLSAGGSGVCNNNHTCVQCNAPSDCRNAVNSCQERTCSAAGACGARVRTGDSCTSGSTSGYCTSAAQCVECVSPSTCPGSRPFCVQNACRQCGSDNDCGSPQIQCRNFQCVSRCGNGTVERSAGEECEVGGAWTSSNCLLCRQNVYTPSEMGRGCMLTAADTAAQNFLGPGNCTRYPGYTPTCFSVIGSGCYIACNNDSSCPVRMRCVAWADGNIPAGYAINTPFSGYCQ